MKTLVLMITAAVSIVSCNSDPRMNIGNSGSAAGIDSSSDTAGLAEFKTWKQEKQFEQYLVKRSDKPTTVMYPVKSSHPVSRRDEATGAVESPVKQEQTKKGWSKAAKGAAIGGGSGAVLGAIIHKRNRVVGGVVGGVVGAGVGYGIGRHMDKKDGRY